MAGSTLGTIFSVSTWGESHGKGVGVVIDGCPAGLSLTEQDIQIYLNRRKPGQSRFTTPRKEDDTVEILSGVFEGRTTGTPISLMVRNTSQRSKDYSEIASYYRPGHADYTYDCKYGFRDYTGGGRSSGPRDHWTSGRRCRCCKTLAGNGHHHYRLYQVHRSGRDRLQPFRPLPDGTKCSQHAGPAEQLSLPWHISTSAVQKKIPAAAWWNASSKGFPPVWASPALIN